MGRADLSQLRENVELETGNLGHGFDDEVYFRKLVQRRCWRQVRTSFVGLLFGDALLGNIFR